MTEHKQSSSLALAEDNRVLREALDQLIKATTNLLIHVDTSTCGGALLTFYHEAKSAKNHASAALTRPQSTRPVCSRWKSLSLHGDCRDCGHPKEMHDDAI